MQLNEQRMPTGMTPKILAKWGGICVAILFALVFIAKSYVNIKPTEIAVLTYPFTGKQEVILTPGTKLTLWGSVAIYQRSEQYWFDDKDGHHAAYPVKFNDGGHADIPGSVRIIMPTNAAYILRLYNDGYTSSAAVAEQLVGQALMKSITLTGPTMSSKESYAEKKNEFLYNVEDQALHGIYKTIKKEIQVKDELTGNMKDVITTEILRDSSGLPVRSDKSQLEAYGINLAGLATGDFKYDDVVKKQIASQQNTIMAIQTSMAESQKATQVAITAEQEGKANAAKAEWAQKEKNATIVAEAEGRKLAADQDNQAAEFERQAKIKRAQGDAEAMRLKTVANNNLDKKAEIWLEERKAAWDAFAKHQGPMTPSVVTGGGNGGSMNATDYIQLMGIKAARDLNLDLQTK